MVVVMVVVHGLGVIVAIFLGEELAM